MGRSIRLGRSGDRSTGGAPVIPRLAFLHAAIDVAWIFAVVLLAF